MKRVVAMLSELFPGYFGDLNKKLAQQYQACEVTRYTTPATPPPS